MKKQTGLTLIELIIVVVILGIMAAYAVPNYSSIVRNSQLRTSYNNLAGVISTARSEAANRSTVITACVSTDQSNCVANSSSSIWSDGYIIFTDANGNAQVDADDDEVLLYEPPVGSGISIVSAIYENSISIAPRGRLPDAASFVFCSGNDVNTARALNLWVTGLGRLATDSADDADTIVEDINGNNVTCP